ncbi:aspartyl-phosphate phosphatase Spo0E family protein [Paenibacillus doosanensis]|uniref:Spo0E like sporulation regulatory protein n=1 Tax=Paenibacillus konkukensis TaxID=2020716 RepID=A0ABY4RI25_9BACL|nr:MULTISPECIES: aspartyl-phosphate phosphatase Spo0E family protein [Paenibacillus]MCS7461979.1 aspartyl-phosphate phosphatase Spo0E family protein [Paenibacillus doosanensis]UQZ81491.1 Spo0E like sporulation regulatory protein [Paenibacillus konkukensis]
MDLNEMIEKLRDRMIQTAMRQGNLCDKNVVELSQQLDVLLLAQHRRRCYQRSRGKRASAARTVISSQ